MFTWAVSPATRCSCSVKKAGSAALSFGIRVTALSISMEPMSSPLAIASEDRRFSSATIAAGSSSSDTTSLTFFMALNFVFGFTGSKWRQAKFLTSLTSDERASAALRDIHPDGVSGDVLVGDVDDMNRTAMRFRVIRPRLRHPGNRSRPRQTATQQQQKHPPQTI